jgi:hypothetical protein
MTLKELLLQELETSDDAFIAEILAFVRSHKHEVNSSATLTSTLQTQPSPLSIVEFFRHSPLCEVADELDLTRDLSTIPNRIVL